MPRFLRLLMSLAAAALFGLLVWTADLAKSVALIGDLGWRLVPVLAIYAGAFAADTVSWHLVIHRAPLTWRWFTGLWRIRLMGMAVNQVVPLVGLAGEPVKALLLNRRFGVPRREAGASLLVAKTANLLGLAIFLSVGAIFVLADVRLPEAYRTMVIVGSAAVVFGIGLVFAVQRLRLLSWLGRKVAMARRLEGNGAFDDLVIDAYTRRRPRFLSATLLTLLNWIFGAVELYVILRLLGAPVSLYDAWSVQAVVELVRAASFFIPASLGVQEGAYVAMLTSLTGDASLGLAAALVRRARELLWIGAGLVAGWGALEARPTNGERHGV